MYNSNVNRIRAEEDIRTLYLLASAESQKGFEALQSRLEEDYGEPIQKKRTGIIPPEKGAFEKLKALQNVR